MTDFHNHKKTLEDFLQSVDFIYSGDIITSIDKKITEKSKHSGVSVSLFKKFMIEIYNYSIQNMFFKSKEIIVHRNSFTDIYDLMNRLKMSPKIIFYSTNSTLNLGLGVGAESQDDVHSYVPNYFNRRFRLMAYKRDVSTYYSPLIKDDPDDCHFYLVDRPIQSMVWCLQNMDYLITKGFTSNEHAIKSQIYDCDFEVYKIRVVNTQKLRQDKINSIINDN